MREFAAQNRWMIVGGFVLVAVALGVAVGAGGMLAMAALAAAVAVVAGFLFPREAVIAVVLFGLVQFGPTRAFPILPEQITYLDDVVLAGAAIRWVVDTISGGVPVLPWAGGWLIAWLATALATSVLRHVPSDAVVLALRAVLLPVFVVPVIATYARDDAARRTLLKWIGVIGVVHALVAAGQWAASPYNVDAPVGLLGQGGANLLGFMLGMTALMTLGREKIAAWWYGAALADTLGIIVASARAAMLAFPIGLLVLYRTRLVRRVRNLVAVVAIAAAAYFALGYYFSVSGNSGLSRTLDPTALISQQDTAVQGGRLLYLTAVPRALDSVPAGWVSGLGPGSFTSIVAVNRRAPGFLQVAPISVISKTGFANADVEWAAVTGEYGLVGLACMLALILRPVWLALWDRSTEGEGAEWVRKVAPAVLVIALVGLTTTNMLEYQPVAYLWWTFVGLAEAALSPALAKGDA